MAEGFSQEQLTQLAQLISGALDARLPAQQTVAVPTAVPTESQVVVLGNAESSKRTPKQAFTDEQIAAQRAADLLDPNRNAYTVVARNRIVGQYRYEDYVPVWTAERDRLVRGGMPKGAANKQAQVNYDAHLKAEAIRLRDRDGIGKSTMAPVISAESRRSSGTHSDPTANQAIGNVSRQERAAELRRQAEELEREATTEMSTISATPSVKVRSAASVAQVAVGANPRQRWVDSIVRDAKASGNAGQFIQTWFDERKRTHPNNVKNSRLIALAAASALKIGTA